MPSSRATRFCCFLFAVLATLASLADGPVLFAPGVVSTGMDDAHATFTADGRTLYFLRSTPDFAHWTILVSHLERGRWQKPKVAPFSGRWADGDVFLTADEQRIYFISNRPPAGDVARHDTEIWTVVRDGSGWGTPRPVAELSSPGDEWYPTLTRDGTIYFGSDRPGGHGGCDIWRARRVGDGFGPPENLGAPLNTAEQEVEPYVSPDETFIIFSGKRAGSQGAYDLFLTWNCRGEWTTPQPLGAGVNSAGWDFGPRLTPDGRTFFFTSNRSDTAQAPQKALDYEALMRRLASPRNGLRDIYRIEATELAMRSPCGE